MNEINLLPKKEEKKQKSRNDEIQEEIESLKEKIKNVNEDEQKSRGFKIKDKRGKEEIITPDRDKLTQELEANVRQLENERKFAQQKERIEQLKKEIKELNTKEQQSYKMENYKVNDRGTIEPDREKMVLEKEEEIRRLELEIQGETKQKEGPEESEESKEEKNGESPDGEANKEKPFHPPVPVEKSKFYPPVPVEENKFYPPVPINPGEKMTEPENLEDKELVNLMSEVERARRNYAKKDYEVTNTFSKIKKALGGNLKFKSQEAQETHYHSNQYKIALNQLLNYQIEKLKDKNLPPEQLRKEIGDLTRYYNQDEKVNLYEAHTNARAEVWENKLGKTPGYLAEKSGQFINWYRKINWKKKMAFSLGAGLVGAGFLVIGQRVLGGAAAGVGVTAALEGRYRKKEGERLQEEQGKIMEDIEKNENAEKKYEKMMEKMQQEIDGYNKDLKTEKDKARNRKLIGATLATLIGSGAASHVIHWGIEKTGVSDALKTAKEFWFKESVDVPAESGQGANSGKESGIRPDKAAEIARKKEFLHKIIQENSGQESMSGGEVPAQTGNAVDQGGDITNQGGINAGKVGEVMGDASEKASIISSVEVAQKGDSVWKMISRQLQSHYGEEFSNLDPAQKTYVIDALKDKVAENPSDFGLKDIDKIKIGQKIDLSKLFENKVEAKGIFENAGNLSPEQLRSITQNNEKIINWLANHPDQPLTSPGVEEIIQNNESVNSAISPDSSTPASPEAPVQEASTNVSSGDSNVGATSASVSPEASMDTSNGDTAASASGSSVNEKVAEVNADGSSVTPKEVSNSGMNLENLDKESLEIFKKYDVSETPFMSKEDAFLSNMMKEMSLNSKENWDIIKTRKIWEINSEVNQEGSVITNALAEKINEMEDDFVRLFGEKARIGNVPGGNINANNETMLQWVARITKLFLASKNKI